MSDNPAIPPTALDSEGNPVGPPPPGARLVTPAATVVVLRDGPGGPEVLLLRRQRGGAFSGMWVFPGGKVETADAEAAGVDAPDGIDFGLLGPHQEIAVARRAAVREALEEAAILLDPDDLVVHSYWLPPPEAPRRFSTWFFVAPAGPEAVVVDDAEVHEYRWLRPADAIEARDAGTIALAPPTWMTLWQVGRHPDVASVLAEAAGRPPRRFETHLAGDRGRSALVWPGDAGYDDGELERPGTRLRLWPSDDGSWRLEASGSTLDVDVSGAGGPTSTAGPPDTSGPGR